MGTDYVVTKSNELIEAKYKLKLEEQRLILYLVSLIEPHDADFKRYEISVADFCTLASLTKDTQYSYFKRISESLISKTITIREANHSTTIVAWLSYANYSTETGKIHVAFDPFLKPYLLQLKKSFTSYKLENILYLKSVYSVRMYELLKQYEKIGFRIFKLAELKEILVITSKSYDLYTNFKQKVIITAERELKEKCDIYFSFEEIKKSRSVDAIKFLIHKNMDFDSQFIVKTNALNPIIVSEEFSPSDNPLIGQVKSFTENNLSERDIIMLLETTENNVQLIKKRYMQAKTQRSINNLTAWLRWAVGQPDSIFETTTARLVRKNGFNNFPSRKIDYAEIERKERELLLRDIETS